MNASRLIAALLLLASSSCTIPPGEPIASIRAVRVTAPDGTTALAALSCPDWTRNSREDFSNRNASNFGCADALNFIGQLAQPSDAVRGRGGAEQDGGAAAGAVQRYRARKTVPLSKASSISDGGSAPGADPS